MAMLRHPKEGHSLLALIAPTPRFPLSAPIFEPVAHGSSCFWVQPEQAGNVKRSALGGVAPGRRMLEWKLRMQRHGFSSYDHPLCSLTFLKDPE